MKMVSMSEKSVINCLDNLLVKMEVYGNKKDSEKFEEIQNEFLDIVNHYAEKYPLLIPKYQEKGNIILNKYYDKEKDYNIKT